MPIGGFRSSATQTVPEPSRSLLARTGTALFDIINLPANVTKSAIRFGQTGDIDYLYNITKNLSLFHEARDVPIEDITKTEDFLTNVAASLLTDPLMLVSGVAPRTAFGIATATQKSARIAAKVMSAKRKVAPEFYAAERVLEFHKQSRAAAKALQKVKPGPERALIQLEAIPFVKSTRINIGSFDRLQALVKQVHVLPDVRIPELVKQMGIEEVRARKFFREASEARSIKSATGKRIQAEKAERQAEVLADRLQGMPRGITGALISPEKVNVVRDFSKKGIAGKFRTKINKPLAQTNIDLMKTGIALDLFDLHNRQTANLAARMDKLGEMAGEVVEEMGRRVTKVGEARHAAVPGFDPSIDQLINAGVGKARNKLAKDLRHIRKEKGLQKKEAIEGIYKTFRDKITDVKRKAEPLRLRNIEAQRIVGATIPEEMDLARFVYEDLESILPIADRLGVDLQKLTSAKGFLSFVPRLPTKGALALKKSNPRKYASINREMVQRLSGSKRRRLYPTKDIDEINTIIRNDYKVDFDFFDTNIVRQLVERKAEHVKAIHKAVAVHVLTSQFGAAKKLHSADRKISDLFKLTGLKSNAIPIGKVWMSDDIFRWATNTADFMKRPDEITGKFFRVIDSLSNVWRIGLTTIFPAFHNRNLLDNMVRNGMAGVGSLRLLHEGMTLNYRAAKGILTATEAKTWVRLNEHGAVNAGVFDLYKEILGKAPTPLREFAEAPMTKIWSSLRGKQFSKRGITGVGDPLSGQAWGQFIESSSRIAHFLGMERKGLSSLDAMRSMNRWLFDPRDITNFERERLRPFILFYTWMRNNLPLMLNTALTDPRALSIYNDITGIGKDDAPTWLRGGAAFRAPAFLGDNVFVGNIGLGIEDLHMFNINAADPSGNFFASLDEIQRLGEKLLSRTTPVLQAPLQIFSGREFFSGRDLNQTSTVRFLSSFLPTSRLTGTSVKAIPEIFNIFGADLDTDKGFIARMFDLGAGARVYKLSSSNEINKRRLELLGTGKFKRSRLFILPKDREDKAAQEMLRQFRKWQSSQRK